MTVRGGASHAAVFALFVTACAVSPPRPVGAPFSEKLRHELVGSLRMRNRSIQAFKGLATVRYGSRLFGVRGEAAIVLRRPYQLRVDGLSEFGLYETQLVISNGDLLVHWPTKGRFFRGLAGPDSLKRYLAVPLNPEVAIDLLSGVVPLEDEEEYFLKSRRGGKEYLLKGRSGEMVITKNGSLYLPVRYTAWDVSGSRDYRVVYSDYTEVGGHWFPGRLVARFSEAAIEIRFHTIELNPAIDGRLFELKVPDDAIPLVD